MSAKFVFITGGVVSGLGKGIAAASLAALLRSSQYKVVCMKLDPYINQDPGTMSPLEHGEVWVTQDGGETDLDLGHYERFMQTPTLRCHNLTSGQVYAEVMRKERQGDYLGRTVQVIPHITDQMQQYIEYGAKDADFAIVEIGGTVGDIESLPFLESIRQMRLKYGMQQSLFMHLTLVPFVEATGEKKTKPTQHSVKELRSIGIQPDIILCRSGQVLTESEKKKISLFTNVHEAAVVSLVDVASIYEIPERLHAEGVGRLMLAQLGNLRYKPDLTDWHTIVSKQKMKCGEVDIALVGKYMNLRDAYKSVIESFEHAAIALGIQVRMHYLDVETIDFQVLEKMHAIVVPGGFGERGVERMIAAGEFAYDHKIPYFGICLGMQTAVIMYARKAAQLPKANSTEFDEDSPSPVIALMREWEDDQGNKSIRDENSDMGGTMRLGSQNTKLKKGSLIHSIYGKTRIAERHRHRYEVNKKLLPILEKAGMQVTAWSEQDDLVDAIELPEHPWFIGCQYHPEFQSYPLQPHALFQSLVQAAKQRSMQPSRQEKEEVDLT
jgi:CTP synthase